MNKAMLSQDYHDAGANRVVSVLEELRSGLMNKLEQELVLRNSLPFGSSADCLDSRVRTFRAVIDDIALFIQREQR